MDSSNNNFIEIVKGVEVEVMGDRKCRCSFGEGSGGRGFYQADL